MVRVAVNGALGRMGQRILALAKGSGQFEATGAFDEKQPIALSGKGVLIDFSSPEGTVLAAQAASKAGWGLVVGTTGLTDKEREVLKKASAAIPVVVSSNMGIGINFLLGLLDLAGKKLPEDFDIQITEAHHIHKKDAPSGTALMLAEAIAKAKNWDAGRIEKERGRIKSIREGEIVGDHSVLFKGLAETIEIKHHAESRDVFAKGALVAAQFVSKKSTGLFTMRDVLGL